MIELFNLEMWKNVFDEEGWILSMRNAKVILDNYDICEIYDIRKKGEKRKFDITDINCLEAMLNVWAYDVHYSFSETQEEIKKKREKAVIALYFKIKGKLPFPPAPPKIVSRFEFMIID